MIALSSRERLERRPKKKGLSAFVAFAKDVFARMNRARTFGIAAEMSFWVFLSLLPLAAVAGLVAAKFAYNNWSAVGPLLGSLPPATRDLLTRELSDVAAWNGGEVAAPAAAVFVWLASAGVHAIFDAIEEQTGAARPWWKKRLIAVAVCVGMSVGVLFIALVQTGLQWVGHLSGGVGAWTGHGSALDRIWRAGAGVAILFGMIVGLYWIGICPNIRKKMPIVPGALVAVGLQVALGFGYTLYIGTTGDGGAYQAGLATIGVTMMALYLFSVAVLTGVTVNRVLGDRAAKRGRGAHAAETATGKGEAGVQGPSAPASSSV